MCNMFNGEHLTKKPVPLALKIITRLRIINAYRCYAIIDEGTFLHCVLTDTSLLQSERNIIPVMISACPDA